jgi:hypothetical protein
MTLVLALSWYMILFLLSFKKKSPNILKLLNIYRKENVLLNKRITEKQTGMKVYK